MGGYRRVHSWSAPSSGAHDRLPTVLRIQHMYYPMLQIMIHKTSQHNKEDQQRGKTYGCNLVNTTEWSSPLLSDDV